MARSADSIQGARDDERAERDLVGPAREAVRVVGLSSGGEGVGRLEDGRVVFVEGGVPGDLVEPRNWIERKRMVRIEIGRLIESSPDRIDPLCAHFGVCGGCLWQHVEYGAQLAAKLQSVRDALERIGRLSLDVAVEIVPSPAPYGYRARARLVEQEGRVGFRRRSSREVEPVEHCPVLVPAAETRRIAITESVARARAEASARRPDAAASTPSRRRREREWVLLAGARDSVVSGRVGDRAASGERLELDVLGERLQASLESFVQGNALLWDALAEEVRAQALTGLEVEIDSIAGVVPAPALSAESNASLDARPDGPLDALPDAPIRARVPSRFVELYAGIGFLTLPLARAGLSGVALERDRSAIRDLTRNLVRAGLAERVEVVGGRVERRGDLPARFARADVLIVDPPRSGIEESVRKTIAQSGPARIVYVSCDPATLARDLRFLAEEGGYGLKSLRAFDLFPQTPHVETVSRLERIPARD